MKTSMIAASVILATLLLGSVATTYAYHVGFPAGPHPGANGDPTTTSTTTSHSGGHDNGDQNDQGQDERDEGGHFNLTVGETFILSNLAGHWVAFSNQSSRSDSFREHDPFSLKVGNSTGSFTFKVTSVSDEGANLTITKGTFSINGTTYTVSSGHLALNEGLESGFGNGTASHSATFEIHVAGIHGNITSNAQVGAVKLDVKAGSNQYLVILGTHEALEEENNSD